MSGHARERTSAPDRRARGALGEEIAAAFLALRGYRITERNYRSGHREIDLVAERGRSVIFVEVKMRVSSDFGGPGRAVGHAKQSDIVCAAIGYIREKAMGDRDLRFDVVTIESRDTGRALHVEHIENAFEGGARFSI
jgi:putative endonuclease